jgi:hypothetical protein
MYNSAVAILIFILIPLNTLLTSTGSAVTIIPNEPKPVYMQIDYWSIPAELIPQMMIISQQYLLPGQIDRVKSGTILDWNLYEALIAGPEYQYNFVSITKTTSYGELFGEWDSTRLADGLVSLLPPNIQNLNYSLISPKYSEIWVMQGAALGAANAIDNANIPATNGCQPPSCLILSSPATEAGQSSGEPIKIRANGQNGALPSGNYITKNFMDTRGSNGEHFTLELDFWRPIHHVRIDRNILNSWAMYTLSKPGGSSRKYTYSTIDYYDRLSDIEGFDSRELAGIAHPDFSDQEISSWMNRTGPSRTAWKTELWRRVLGTHAQ